MKDSTLLRSLALLNANEWMLFQSFFQSPLFLSSNSPRAARALFLVIVPHYPDFQSPELERESVAGLLFPEHKKPLIALKKSMSHLLDCLFLFQHALQSGSIHPDHLTSKGKKLQGYASLYESNMLLAELRFYRKNQLSHVDQQGTSADKAKNPEQIFNKKYNEAQRWQNELQHFNELTEYEFTDLLFRSFCMEQEKTLQELGTRQLDHDSHILAAMDSLDRFYITLKFDLLAKLLYLEFMVHPFAKKSRAEESRYLLHKQMADNMVASLLRAREHLSPQVLMTCHLLRFLSDPLSNEAVQSAEIVELELEQHPETFPAERLGDYTRLLRSFWNKRYMVLRDVSQLSRIFDNLRQELYQLQNREYPSADFLYNFLSVSLKIGKKNVLEKVLIQYAGHAPVHFNDQTHPTYNYLDRCIWWARLFVANGDVQRARDVLPHYYTYGEISNIYTYSYAALTDVMIRYLQHTLLDLESENMMRNAIARFERKEEMADDHRKYRVEFIKTTKALARSGEAFSLKDKKEAKKALAHIREKLDSQYMANWEWLDEQYRLLKAKIENK